MSAEHMSSLTWKLDAGPRVSVSVTTDMPYAVVTISQLSNNAAAYLETGEIDALIRALAAARVEISNERPR